jgi:hypothetical protein
MLEIHSKSVGKSLEDRTGFNPINGEYVKDENDWKVLTNFKRYRVNLSDNLHVYLNTNTAFELASCLDTFNAKYQEFKAKYQPDVYCFETLEIGDVFYDSIREDNYKVFVKYDYDRAQYLDRDLTSLQESFRKFDRKYKLLKSSHKIKINNSSIVDQKLESRLLEFVYNFLLLPTKNILEFFMLIAVGLSIGLAYGNKEQLSNQASKVVIFLSIGWVGAAISMKKLEDKL